MGMNRRILIACAAVLALAAPTAAQAAPTWLAPTPLDGAHDYAPSAATSAGGDTILGLRDTSNGAPYPASAAFRPAGGPTSAIARWIRPPPVRSSISPTWRSTAAGTLP
jgi:hypothetical protein